jgi:lipopolysaccharide/colanic/teichoic acid biosynthesis glycosyltransferase
MVVGAGTGRQAEAMTNGHRPGRRHRRSEAARRVGGWVARWARRVTTIPLPDGTAAGGTAPRRMPGRVAKRVLDVMGALVLVVITLPLALALALAVKVGSPGPTFYRAPRVGHRGAPLLLLKFRKMHHDAGGLHLTVRADARLTPVGRFLMRTHLDELPQLWQVLRGQMSLVGPRPEDPRFVACHRAAYEHVLSVRPGITGWTQLVMVEEGALLARAADPVRLYVDEVLPAKVALDSAYVRAGRVLGDVTVLGWTLLVLVCGCAVVMDPARREMRLVRRPGGVRPAPQPAVGDAGQATEGPAT